MALVVKNSLAMKSVKLFKGMSCLSAKERRRDHVNVAGVNVGVIYVEFESIWQNQNVFIWRRKNVRNGFSGT